VLELESLMRRETRGSFRFRHRTALLAVLGSRLVETSDAEYKPFQAQKLCSSETYNQYLAAKRCRNDVLRHICGLTGRRTVIARRSVLLPPYLTLYIVVYCLPIMHFSTT